MSNLSQFSVEELQKRKTSIQMLLAAYQLEYDSMSGKYSQKYRMGKKQLAERISEAKYRLKKINEALFQKRVGTKVVGARPQAPARVQAPSQQFQPSRGTQFQPSSMQQPTLPAGTTVQAMPSIAPSVSPVPQPQYTQPTYVPIEDEVTSVVPQSTEVMEISEEVPEEFDLIEFIADNKVAFGLGAILLAVIGYKYLPKKNKRKKRKNPKKRRRSTKSKSRTKKRTYSRKPARKYRRK